MLFFLARVASRVVMVNTCRVPVSSGLPTPASGRPVERKLDAASMVHACGKHTASRKNMSLHFSALSCVSC